VLRETGFIETTSLPGLTGPTGGEGQIGLLARKSYEEASVRAETTCKRRRRNHGLFSPIPREWVKCWFRDCAYLAPGAASPRRETVSSSMATTLLPCDRGRWKTGKQLVKDCQVSSPERIVYLWNLDAPTNGADMATNLDALLHLTPGARISCSRSKVAPGLGNAERSACR